LLDVCKLSVDQSSFLFYLLRFNVVISQVFDTTHASTLQELERHRERHCQDKTRQDKTRQAIDKTLEKTKDLTRQAEGRRNDKKGGARQLLSKKKEKEKVNNPQPKIQFMTKQP
jgi:hypothetical protein